MADHLRNGSLFPPISDNFLTQTTSIPFAARQRFLTPDQIRFRQAPGLSVSYLQTRKYPGSSESDHWCHRNRQPLATGLHPERVSAPPT